MAGDDVFVDQWVADARLLANYGQQTGLFDPSRILLAASKVEALPNKTLGATEVDDLKKLVSLTQDLLPKMGGSSIWLDLKTGWMPFKSQSKVKKRAYLLIAVSVLLVIIIGQLTIAYNQGTLLLSDLRVLRATEPERRTGQLSRQLIAAMKEIATANAPVPPLNEEVASLDGKAPAAAPPVTLDPLPANAGTQGAEAPAQRSVESSLPLQAYFQIYDDAWTLNKQIAFLKQRVDEFKLKARTPVWGSWLFLYGYYSLQDWLGIAGRDEQSFLAEARIAASENDCFLRPKDPTCVLSESPLEEMDTKAAAPADKPADKDGPALQPVGTQDSMAGGAEDAVQAPPPAVNYPQGSECNDLQISWDADRRAKMLKDSLKWTGFAEVAQEYALGTAYLTCFDGINAVRLGSRPIDIMESEVSQALSPYAFWLLPALYGALGALLFHLRIILDPRLPDPEGIRIVHRIALGMLAGMILAWFWVPNTTIGGQIAGIGLGLFTLAFVFGFSLDVFFSLLERLVSLGTAAVDKVGPAKAG